MLQKLSRTIKKNILKKFQNNMPKIKK